MSEWKPWNNVRNYKGITYVGTYIGPEHYKWDGGPVGGVVYQHPTGNGKDFGSVREWFYTFEEAADVVMANYRKSYELAKRKVNAYEEQLKNREWLELP